MKETSQSGQIADRMMQLLAAGIKTKEQLVTKIVDEMDVPRPTARRVKGQLEKTLKEYLKVLK